MEQKSLSRLTKDIVDSRKIKSDDFGKYQVRLNKISTSLNFIYGLDNNELWTEIVSKDSENQDEWNSIFQEAKTLKEELADFVGADGDFTIAKSRADRSYVNIGSIGIMREGKSEFIAQTTSLNKWILPRKKGEHACTTTSINVINGASPDGKTQIVRVYYYTVSDIVNLFVDYLEELELDSNQIDKNISTRKQLQSWCHQNAKRLAQEIPSKKSKLGKVFLEYLNNIDKYVNRLCEKVDKEGFIPQTEDKKEDNKKRDYYDYEIADIEKGEKIAKEYYSSVSYYESPDSQPGSEVFTSFATRKADIYTTFDIDGTHVDNIQFLDTPGIGEKKVGVDRILSDAVSMNLDIIIAIRAINGSPKEEQEQTFLNILREKLADKKSSKDWVYYLLNVWDGEDYSSVKSCKDDLVYHLKIGSENSAIELKDDHFCAINLRDGYELKPDNTTDSNNPIGKYLHRILSNLIPQIDTIDADFFKKATTKYNDLLERYGKLSKDMAKLHLPKYDDYGRIQELIGSLQTALAKENAKTPEIMTTIKHHIDQFCSQPCGTLVGLLFGVNNEMTNGDSDDFCSKHKEAIQLKYDKGGYNAYYDFQNYSNLKTTLMEIIKDDIYGRIDQTEADDLLSKTQDTIATVFISTGKMSFITDNEKEWYEQALSLFSEEGGYPYLEELISSFANHKINAREIIEPRVTAVVTKCIHHDDFGDPDEYDFQTYENATNAIIHSLFNIEQYAKGLISDGLVKDDIEQLQLSFEKIYYELTKLAATTDPHKSNKVRDELYHFYENHSAEVFKDDRSLQKRGLVTSWKNNLKE